MAEYQIVIKIGGLPESDGATAKTTQKTTAEESGGETGGVMDAYKAIKKASFGIVSYATAKSFADQVIGFQISQVSLETGANEYEQRLNMGYEIGNSVFGAGVSLLTGALVGGPAGLALSAVGIVLNGVHKAVGIAQRQQQLDTQTDLENISINLARRRAGFTGSRSLNQ